MSERPPDLDASGRPVAVTPGNVDLYAQPKVKNPDGSISTVDSRSYNIDGKEVLLPSVTPDGRHLQNDAEIVAEYRKTGRHLGMFPDVPSANAYAAQLHNDYASGKYDTRPQRPPDLSADGSPETDVPSGTATAATSVLRGVPAGIKATAGAIADSPAAQRMTQKIIMGTVRGAGAVAGNTLGGVPGAIVGGAVTAGMTPTQASIRGAVGRLSGEAPALTDAAIKAQAITDYGKGVGIKVSPSAIVDNPAAGGALDNYAGSMGKRIVRLYGPSGEIVSGPQAVAPTVAAKAPGLLSKIGSTLPWLQGATGVTDFAQTVEPDRHDIGVAGIGRTQHVPGEHPALLNAILAKLRAYAGGTP